VADRSPGFGREAAKVAVLISTGIAVTIIILLMKFVAILIMTLTTILIAEPSNQNI
jgi:hypothetical protein